MNAATERAEEKNNDSDQSEHGGDGAENMVAPPELLAANPYFFEQVARMQMWV